MATIAKLFVILSWLGAIAGAGLGLAVLVSGMTSAQSAPQEAVVCALACALGILPYCLARAVTEIVRTVYAVGSDVSEIGVEPKAKVNSNDYNYLKLGQE